MLVDVQVSWYVSSAHVQRLFPPKWRSRWLWHNQVMSLSFCLCKWRGYIRKHTQALGFFFSSLSLVCSLVDSSGKPQTLCLSYLGAFQGVGLSPYRKVFFICSSACAQGYLGHPELVCFSWLWASWVACHPVLSDPLPERQGPQPLEQNSTCRINHDLNEPTKSIQHPWRESHIDTYLYPSISINHRAVHFFCTSNITFY